MFLSCTNESVIELQSCIGSALSERVGLQEMGGFISKGESWGYLPTLSIPTLSIPTSSILIWSTFHFVNSHFVDSHLVNVDEVGIDKVGIDKVVS